METRKVCIYLGLFCLALFGIPIRIQKQPTPKHEEIQFQDYIKRFNKSYLNNHTEYLIRLENFKVSLKQIEKLNKGRPDNTSAVYGLTVYSDLTEDEFTENRLQRNRTHPKRHLDEFDSSKEHSHEYSIINNLVLDERTKRAVDDLPKKVDYRVYGVISEIRNQRTCGACWAFSTIETVEAMNALKNRSLQQLSVQEMIDCAKNGNYGCEGGDTCSLLDWLVKSQIKITLDKSYPFTYETQTCKLKGANVGIQVKNFTCDKFVGSENLLLQKLAYHGPVAVAVNAVNWQFYLGGIIQFHCSGAPENLNHAVQIVGYDLTGSVPFYIVRNSWGPEFGDKGYLYIAIGDNICGLANEVSSLDVV